MRKLANPSWRTIDGALSQMESLLQQGDALAWSEFDRRPVSADVSGQPGLPQLPHGRPDAVRPHARHDAGRVGRAENGAAQDVYDLAVEAIKGMGGIKVTKRPWRLDGTIRMYSAEELTLLQQAIAAAHQPSTAVWSANQVNGEAREGRHSRRISTRDERPGHVRRSPCG